MESKGENTYPIIPKFRKKFKPLQVKDIIENELRGKLENEKYHVDKAAKQAREITDAIKKKLKGWLGSCKGLMSRCSLILFGSVVFSLLYSRCCILMLPQSPRQTQSDSSPPSGGL